MPRHNYPRAGTRMPTKNEKDRIRRILGQKWDFRFLRCPARSITKKNRFEEAGDFSHSANNHVCDVCRCEKTAGWRSIEDLYGIKGIGHYGVGFCGYHAQSPRYAPNRVKVAQMQIEALQAYGVAMAEAIGREAAGMDAGITAAVDCVASAVAHKDINEVELVRQTRTAASEVYRELSRMLDVLRGNAPKNPQAVVDELVALREQIHSMDEAPVELIEHIDQIVFGAKHLTERAGSSTIPMTDKSMLELVAKLGRTVSAINLDHFRMTENDYIEKEEVAIRMRQSMNTMGQVLSECLGDDKGDEIRSMIIDRAFVPVWMNL